MRGLLLVLVFVTLFANASDLKNIATAKDSTDMLYLTRVIIIGNKKTLDRIILRELSLKEGDSVMRFELEKILVRDKNKIYNLRLFNFVNLQTLELPDKSFDLLIEVEERWYIFPVPIFELSDRNFNEWWENYDHKLNRVNYGLRLFQYNFRGRNETIKFTAQFGFTKRFELSYIVPYIDKKLKQGLTFNIGYSEPKNLAYQTVDHKLVYLSDEQTLRKRFSTSISYSYRKSFYESHAVTLEYDNGTIADTILTLNTQNNNPDYYVGGQNNQWYTALSYVFSSEHRDVIAYPLNGYQLLLGMKHYGFLPKEKVNLTTFTASLAWHKSIGHNFYLSNFSSGYLQTPSNQPYSLYYGQGYQKRFVRGYEIYVIEGPWYGLNKTTLKKKLFQRTFRINAMPWEQFKHLPVALYLKSFADFGYTGNYSYYNELNINNKLSNRFIAGMGMGLDLVTSYDSIFRVEYTFSADGDQGFFFHIKKEF